MVDMVEKHILVLVIEASLDQPDADGSTQRRTRPDVGDEAVAQRSHGVCAEARYK